MKNKRFLAAMMVMILSTLMMAMPVSAATPELVPQGLQSENVTEKAEGLTPDGNLTLVDDFSGENTAGKQFVTLATKNGNYFYLIIDRDDEGKETVHFLNQVDEADLLALMEEEQIESLGLNEDPVQIVEEEPEEIIVEEIEPVESDEPKISTGVIVSSVVVLAGMLIVAAVKFKDMKKQSDEGDAAPEEDEEYYEFVNLEQELNGEGLDEESI